MNSSAHIIMEELRNNGSFVDKQFLNSLYYKCTLSRKLDELEERELFPKKKIAYQFSAKGHELTQVALGHLLSHSRDAVSVYYRCRPLWLSLGLKTEEALQSAMAKAAGFSLGRDTGVLANLPSRGGASVLPMAGDVGSQYSIAAGWAEGLKKSGEKEAIAVAMGGDGSVASSGFWSALNWATVQELPMLFFIQDNGYAISVKNNLQMTSKNVHEHLSGVKGLKRIFDDGLNPEASLDAVKTALDFVRTERKPLILTLKLPRLSGHSGQDKQSYKSEALKEAEQEKDPLSLFKTLLIEKGMNEQVKQADERADAELKNSLSLAEATAEPETSSVFKDIFSSNTPDTHSTYEPSGRMNMLAAIRKTLETELKQNQKLLVFGEDVGEKGGVHAATQGLQESFGAERVYDTSLSEEGIIGRSVGLALNGYFPVPEIQFRKYADPAVEHLRNIGTLRWRTANHFEVPMVVRMPGGYAKAGDPCHSLSAEAEFLHMPGWRLAYPSRAEDAVGLLRYAMRQKDPVFFIEQRFLLDAPSARGPYPGDDYVLPFGQARVVCEGEELTVVTWGGMVHRVRSAIDILKEDEKRSIELIDLRTLAPWDKGAVERSLKKTGKCLVVHEDTSTCGFGAEILAHLGENCFKYLDAPLRRLSTADVPIPYNKELMNVVLPNEEKIYYAMKDLLDY